MNDMMKTSAEEVEGGHTVELVACAEVDGTVTKHLYAVAFICGGPHGLMASRYWEETCTGTTRYGGGCGHSETNGVRVWEEVK